MFPSSTESEISYFQVVVVQRRLRNVRKAWCTCKLKLLFCQSKPIAFLPSSLPSPSSSLKLPSNRTGTSVDDCTRKLKQLAWLMTERQIRYRKLRLVPSRAFPTSNDLPVLLLNQPKVEPSSTFTVTCDPPPLMSGLCLVLGSSGSLYLSTPPRQH